VFMIGCLKDKWDNVRSSGQFRLPDNLFTIAGTDTEEARRLFYVAMTRARRSLVISYPEHDNNGKPLVKSQFLAEIAESEDVLQTAISISNDDLVRFQLQTLGALPPALPQHIIDTDFARTLLDKYSLSVTHLNQYLKCPVSFYFNNLVKVPSAKNGAMTFGSAVHFALEKLFRNMNAHADKEFGSKADLLRDFKWYMRRNEEAFTPADFKRRMEYGEQILPKFYDKYIGSWNKVTSIERSYRNVVVQGVPMNGKLDKLEFDGKFVNVVDYKTGKFTNAAKKLGRPEPEKVLKATEDNKEPGFEHLHGGDYWRQAVFYKILIDNDTSQDWEMRSVEFDFVEPDRDTGEFIRHRVDIDATDVETVKKQVVSTYRSIMNKEFGKGCGKADCEWCTFVNDYYAGTGIHDLSIQATVDAEA
jgi:DNA helicase-2/ATP-dependent DNA helicase PcrA